MEKWKKKTVELVSKLLVAQDDTASVVPYYPQKTRTLSADRKYFKRVRPERHGISSSRLYAMLCELEEDARANVHSIMVLCGGEVIAECSAPGYSVSEPHLSHSMSKTVTGIAIGMLVDDGALSLNQRVAEFFPEYKYEDKRFAEMTVEHLLRMSSGSPFAELGTVSSEDWCESFFASSLAYAPGEGFNYNSMNSYILSRIAERVSGRPLSEFLEERLFKPLGISSYLWEKDSHGSDKGGWGLYASCESWAKIGQMMLNGGTSDGKRIVSMRWVSESTSTQSISDGKMGDFNYGYHLWVGESSSEFLFNGMFGQNVWVCPRNDLLVSVNCGNNELFQRSQTLGIIRKYLGSDIHDDMQKASYHALRHKEKTFFDVRRLIMPPPKPSLLSRLFLIRERSLTGEWEKLVGDYSFPPNNVGLLPAFVRIMQNNLASHIEALRIERDDKSVTFVFRESGAEHAIKAGIRDFIYGEYDFRAERYAVRAMCDIRRGAEGDTTYMLHMIFPELPNSRVIEMRESDGGLTLSFSETPDKSIAQIFAGSSSPSALTLMAMTLMKRTLGENFLDDALDLVFSPVLEAVRSDLDGAQARLKQIAEGDAQRRQAYKDLMPLISRFIGDSDSQERRSPFGFIGNLFKRKRPEAEPQQPKNDGDVQTITTPDTQETDPVSANESVKDNADSKADATAE